MTHWFTAFTRRLHMKERPPQRSPLPARGERPDCARQRAIRVRGRIDRLGLDETSPHPEPSLRSVSDLSPHAGRGEERQPLVPYAIPLTICAILLALTGHAAAETSFDCVIDPSETAKLGSPIPGILSEVLVKRGDKVTKGQPVATLESSVEAAAVKLNRFRAESTAKIDAQGERLKFARARVERFGQPRAMVVSQDKYEEMQSEFHVAEQELLREKQEQQLAKLELDRSQATLDQRTIRSTLSGIVSEKKLSAGEFVNQEGYVVTVSRLDPLFVEVYLPVSYYRQVGVGMKAKVTPAPPIENTYAAIISVVDHVFDPASGTFGVRLELANPGNLLPGGQRCKVGFDFVAAPPASER
jgi:RND family efflux transporter MFP subunit